MAMYPVVNYPQARPYMEVGGTMNVTISPTGEPAPFQPDGDIDLYAQASRIFGQLQQPNEFSAPVNTFRDHTLAY